MRSTEPPVTPPAGVRATDPALLIAAAAAAAALWLLYAFNPYAFGYGAHMVTILKFASTLWEGEDWQHCYLVPLAIAGMVYFERSSLPRVPFERAWAGLAVIAFALGLYWIGYRADNVYIGYASFQFLTGGILLWLLGWTWLKALFVPWAFLVFLYPLPFLDNLIAFPLRMIMSEASVHALNLIGITSIRSGTAILSAPDAFAGLRAGARFSVDVADPCSGIRSLFALMMVSALYGHFTQNTSWKKIVLFLSSIPLAIAGNLARILMLTLGIIALGSETAIGSLEEPTAFHMFAGYLVFAVALAGLLAIAWLINADWPKIINRFKSDPRITAAARPARSTTSLDEY